MIDVTGSREGYAEWQSRHPAWAHYDVIDAVETQTRHSMFETPLGLHYEATEPRSGDDREVSYRVQMDTEIVVYGEFPDAGEVEPIVTPDDPPRTRIRASMPGRWVKR